MIRTIVFSLLAVESVLCVALWIRRRHLYPLAAWAMAATAAAYVWLSWVRWHSGAFAYRDAVESSRWLFMLVSSAVCVQAVALLCHGNRWFAAATSVLFAAASVAAAWATPGPISRAWSVGCVVYLASNYWLYTRQPQPETARRYAHGAMLMVAGNAAALAIMGEWRGVWTAEAAGLVLQRLAPIAALVWWIRRPSRLPQKH